MPFSNKNSYSQLVLFINCPIFKILIHFTFISTNFTLNFQNHSFQISHLLKFYLLFNLFQAFLSYQVAPANTYLSIHFQAPVASILLFSMKIQLKCNFLHEVSPKYTSQNLGFLHLRSKNTVQSSQLMHSTVLLQLG